jgi:hypothetical protein
VLLSEGRAGQCSAPSDVKELQTEKYFNNFGEGLQIINGAIICSFSSSASTTDVTPEQQDVLTCELRNIRV